MMLLPALLVLCTVTLQDTAVDPLSLSLRDAIGLAFQNNLTLRGALLDVEASEESFGASWGAFDPTLFANTSYTETVDAPTPVNLVGGVNVGGTAATESDVFNVRTGVRGLLQTGTTWNFDVGGSGVKTQSGGSNKTRVADWSVELIQPLLRNGADDYTMSAVELAAQDVRIATMAATSVANTTLQSVVETYWNLVFARQDVATRKESVSLSQELLQITRRKFEQGLQNRLDVIEVEAELASREEQLLTAETALEQAIDDLRSAVYAPEGDTIWRRPIEPATGYEVVDEAQMLPLDEALETAMVRRPDVIEARMRLERAEIEVQRADNQVLPRLDVTGGYGMNANERTLSDAIQNINDERFREYRLAVDFEVPIGNRTAEHEARRRRVERERASVGLREAKLTGITEVRRESRNVVLQTERVRTTAETVRLRRESYEGEQRRLENDLSTPFLVRQSLRDLLEAIDVEVRARLDLAVAKTNLLAAQGTLLDRLGYSIEQPELSLDEAPPAP